MSAEQRQGTNKLFPNREILCLLSHLNERERESQGLTDQSYAKCFQSVRNLCANKTLSRKAREKKSRDERSNALLN